MVHYWTQVMRLLRLSLQVSFTVSQDGSLRSSRYPFLCVTFWVLVYGLGSYLYFLKPLLLREDRFGCFDDLLRDTFSMYNVKFAVLCHILLGYLAGFFCLVRMHLRDVAGIVSRGLVLYSKAATGLVDPVGNFSKLVKFLIFYLYVSNIAIPVFLFTHCYDRSITGDLERFPFLKFFTFFLPLLLTFPGSVMAVVFFMLMDISKSAIVVLCAELDALTASNNPKPFLESVFFMKPQPVSGGSPLTPVTVHSLRKLHDELVTYMSDVMKTFQLDILVYFFASFYQNILFNYAIVYNFNKLFDTAKVFIFVVFNFLRGLTIMISLWFVCAGPSRVQVQTDCLLDRVTRLSTTAHISPDVMYEIRMFQLQSRNHVVHFNVYGMFKLNTSLLFTMSASVLSYIVILIQFALPPPEFSPVAITNLPNTTTPG